MFKLLSIITALTLYSNASTELNPDNFKDSINSEKIVIVDFYTNYCGWCTKLQSWVDKNKFKTYKLNSEEYRDLSKQFKVNSYPTLIVFKDGKPISKVSGIDDAKDVIKSYNLKDN